MGSFKILGLNYMKFLQFVITANNFHGFPYGMK